MLSGACMCGRIQYEIADEPRLDADRFRITVGQKELAAFESSPKKFRHFCSACGSPIYSQGEKAPWVEIRDDRPQFSEWADPALVNALLVRNKAGRRE